MRVASDSISTLFSLLLLLPLSPALVIEQRSPVLEERTTYISMGAAAAFGALAATTLTNTGDTVITGDCGTCPGTAITGFPPGKCSGTTSAGGTLACNGEAACLTAYNGCKGSVVTDALTSGNLGGLTLAPGVFSVPTSGGTLSGTLTLNGAGNPDGQFIFQFATTFTTAANSKVVLENGAQACNVYFQVGSSASLGADSILEGNVLAYTSIGVGSGATITGTLCALNGAVTLIDDKITAVTSCTL